MPRELLTTVSLKNKLGSALELARTEGTKTRISDGHGLMLVVRATGEASWVLSRRGLRQ